MQGLRTRLTELGITSLRASVTYRLLPPQQRMETSALSPRQLRQGRCSHPEAR